jgi:flagellar biogenesis protein FliO
MHQQRLTSEEKNSFWRRACSAFPALGRLWRTRPPRQLRVCENLALGEKRFLSVVEFGQRKFLVGGTGNSLAMLAVLSGPGQVKGAGPDAASEESSPLWEFVGGEMVRCG